MTDTSSSHGFAHRILCGIAWVSAGAWMTKLFGFVSTLILLHSFSLHQYGTYQLALSFAGLLGILMIVGIDEVFVAQGTRLNGEGKMEERRQLGRSYAEMRLALAVFVFLLAHVAARILAGHYDGDVLSLVTVYAWIFLLVPFERLAAFHFSTQREFRTLAAYGIVQEGTKTILIGALFFTSALTIPHVLITMTVSMTVAAIAFSPFYLHDYVRVTRETRSALELLRAQGPWVVGQRLIRQAEKNLRPFLIELVLGREAVALWGFAEKIYNYASSAFPIDDVLMPTIAHDRSDRERLWHLLERGIKYTVPFYGVVAAMIAVVISPLVHRAFPQYAAGIPLVYAICAYIAFTGPAYILTSFYVSHQEQRRSFWLILLRLLSSVILLPTLCFFFGPLGAALEYDIDLLGYNLLRLKLLLKQYPELEFNPRNLFRIDSYDRAILRKLRERFHLFSKT